MTQLLRALPAFLALAGCASGGKEEVPTYRDDVAPVLTARCVSCHAGPTPAAGYDATGFMAAVGCVANAPATAGPLQRALEGTHSAYVTPSERAILERWAAAGAPASRSGVHPADFVDPRSARGHGAVLRRKRWSQMLDAKDGDACGRCHDGAPNRAAFATTGTAPGATACTSCHSEPDGPLDCGTCHGDGARARVACFTQTPKNDAHRAHVAPSAAKQSGLACATCHPAPTKAGDFSGLHGDGGLQVQLALIAGPLSHFDPTTKRCATRCHAGPGAGRPAPAWNEPEKMGCTSCHASPPDAHGKGACSSCHRETNAAGTALLATALHLNGKVEVGDGTASCGSCHGKGDDPWPVTAPHSTHAAPGAAKAVECSSCHPMPTASHPTGSGAATVRLVGLAARRGLAPSYDATTKTCNSVYCHAGSGAALPSPTWTAGTVSCGSCHGLPPVAPHTSSTGCGTGFCHAGVVTGGALTVKGAARHVDGFINLSAP